MEKQNVTLSLPKETVRKARHIAVERGVSLSALVAETLDRVSGTDPEYEAARQRAKRRLRKGFNLGTNGKATWTRDELHER